MTVAVCAAFINFISIFHLHDQNIKTICDKQLITTMLVKFIHRIFRLSFFFFKIKNRTEPRIWFLFTKKWIRLFNSMEKKQDKYRVTNMIKIVESIFYDSHLGIPIIYLHHKKNYKRHKRFSFYYYFLLLFSSSILY